MSDIKVEIKAPNGSVVGYFVNPKINALPEGDYELTGLFYDEEGELPRKIMLNPQALPYTADMSQIESIHLQLVSVYVQRGRQPVTMTGVGN